MLLKICEISELINWLNYFHIMFNILFKVIIKIHESYNQF